MTYLDCMMSFSNKTLSTTLSNVPVSEPIDRVGVPSSDIDDHLTSHVEPPLSTKKAGTSTDKTLGNITIAQFCSNVEEVTSNKQIPNNDTKKNVDVSQGPSAPLLATLSPAHTRTSTNSNVPTVVPDDIYVPIPIGDSPVVLTKQRAEKAVDQGRYSLNNTVTPPYHPLWMAQAFFSSIKDKGGVLGFKKKFKQQKADYFEDLEMSLQIRHDIVDRQIHMYQNDFNAFRVAANSTGRLKGETTMKVIATALFIVGSTVTTIAIFYGLTIALFPVVFEII